jgi:hypothetical protein
MVGASSHGMIGNVKTTFNVAAWAVSGHLATGMTLR